MRASEELRRLYREGRLIPFVGAGVSRSVEWKSGETPMRGVLWKEFVDEAARQLGFEDPSLVRMRGSDLQILEYFRLKRETLTPLSHWLHNRMTPPDEALHQSAIHQELAQLSKCSLFYTTNYDDFLERSFGLNDRPCSVVAIESHMGARVGGAPVGSEVVKFHGDFNYPDRMVITETQYQRRLAFETPMDLRFRADMLGRAVLFLGYSFNDPNVSYLFHLVNEKLGDLPGSLSGRRAYITVPDPSDFELALFDARNIEVIAVNEMTQTNDIAALLGDLRS